MTTKDQTGSKLIASMRRTKAAVDAESTTTAATTAPTRSAAGSPDTSVASCARVTAPMTWRSVSRSAA